MTEMQDSKTGRRTGWIVAGAVLLALFLVVLVTTPAAISAANGDGATIGGRTVGLLVLAAAGTAVLLRGLRKR